MVTQHLSERPLVLDRTDPEPDQRATTLPPPECWLDLPAPPLDLNGPTAVPYAPFHAGAVERSIFDLFRDVVEQSPDRIAVADNVRELSYRQIWNGACRLAQTIAARAAIGRPVGILLPNDAHYPVAVLGCLAAARPCVLLDRYYPAERNLAIIRDAGLAAIIVEASDRDNEALYPRDIAAIVVDPATDRQSKMVPPPEGALSPDDPAVIVYTSGSTGEPRGVVLSQRAILHRAGQLINSLHLSAADSSLPLGSPCTIAGIQQVLEALVSGALLVKLDLQRVGFGAVLDTIRDRHVTLLFATPTLLRSLARLDGAGARLSGLRCVHPSGEVLLGADLDLLRRCLPDSCGVLVVYGLTEAPAICQWFVPRGIGEEGEARVAVGYRLPGYDCALLDEEDRPLGCEETSELVVRSRYTALGEWQDGRLVSGRFLPDPVDPPLRTLRTGDLVRVRPDGVIIVVGRKDRQVKIRGMRVEPYEVENALRRSPGVLDAAVVAHDEDEGATLVAFVVVQPEEREQAIAALRARLRASLPAYMQPARIVPVEALPLLPGHKVDVEALRAGNEEFISPRNNTERVISDIWANALGRKAISITDDFFDLGGSSVTALEIMMGIEDAFKVQFPVEMLFNKRTVMALACTIDALPTVQFDELNNGREQIEL
jgi:acyl-CoA synthetase (AMP-forming)/AMP-acid ligase II/acyl carrier protein